LFSFCSYLRDMSQFPFKVGAWTPDGTHVEEELGEFANLVVATESWHVFVGYYAKRRMTLRQGARVIREHIPATGLAQWQDWTTPNLTQEAKNGQPRN
jgi:hypothetical protein